VQIREFIDTVLVILANNMKNDDFWLEVPLSGGVGNYESRARESGATEGGYSHDLFLCEG